MITSNHWSLHGKAEPILNQNGTHLGRGISIPVPSLRHCLPFTPTAFAQLLKQCVRLKTLRLYFDGDLIENIAPKAFKTDPDIRELCSIQRVERVQIWDLAHEPIEQRELARWLKGEIESSWNRNNSFPSNLPAYPTHPHSTPSMRSKTPTPPTYERLSAEQEVEQWDTRTQRVKMKDYRCQAGSLKSLQAGVDTRSRRPCRPNPKAKS